jgi:hypothetical protein
MVVKALVPLTRLISQPEAIRHGSLDRDHKDTSIARIGRRCGPLNPIDHRRD